MFSLANHTLAPTFPSQLLQGHDKTVLGIDNNEKRRLLASVSKDATCRIWSYKDAANVVCVAVASGHAKSIIACAFSKLDGSFVVTGESLARSFRAGCRWNVKLRCRE